MTSLCIYVLYPKLVHPLHFSPFYISPFVMVILTGLKILYSFLYRNGCISTIFTFFTFFFYPLSPVSGLP
jgi:hypothetical protein